MRLSFVVGTLSALLISFPAIASDPAVSIKIRHYDNYVYCTAYAEESAAGAAEVADSEVARRFTALAKTLKTRANELLPALKYTKDTLASDIDSAAIEIIMKGESLGDAEFEAFDKMLYEHCQGVVQGGVGLDKELKW